MKVKSYSFVQNVSLPFLTPELQEKVANEKKNSLKTDFLNNLYAHNYGIYRKTN